MGRPKGSKNKSTIEKETAKLQAVANTPEPDGFDKMTDGQILDMVNTRFLVMGKMARGAIGGDIRSVIISGAAGIGKTYSVEQMLAEKEEEMRNSEKPFRYKVVKGAISPIGLYKTLYDYQNPNNVVVLDDADSIFFEDVGVSILKAALDSSPTRWITWNSEAASISGPESRYETEFPYYGSMIFITNTDFQGIIDKGRSKLVPHFEALVSRTIYLDLKVHHRRSIAVWVNYLVHRTRMLQTNYHLTKEQEREAVNWILDNRDNMRSLSLRDAMKVGQFMKSDPHGWKELAEVTLLKTNNM